MNKNNHSPLLKFCLVISLFSNNLFINRPLNAQTIIPDQTLGNENSVVIPNQNINGISSDLIQGGALRGSNLFHSFEQFNINEGRGAYFVNPTAVNNIFSRVTGGNTSQILGTLGVLGNANLWLINPNGIMFGNNAQLDLKGSFLATTASQIRFPDGSNFNAVNPNSAPLLTIDVTPQIGLIFEGESGKIINQSQATNNIGQMVGLEVQPAQNLILIGGAIDLNGGYLTAEQGNIKLASVGKDSLVNLITNNQEWVIGSQNVNNWQDITLAQQSQITTINGGNISLQGHNLTLQDGSGINSYALTNQNGGNIDLNFAQVNIKPESLILAFTQGSGNGGNVQINGTEGINFTGNGNLSGKLISLLSQSFTNADLKDGIFTVSFGSGSAGNLTLATPQLNVENGFILSATAFADGDGGNLTIRDSQTVNVNNAMMLTGTTNIGNSGDLTINTNNFMVTEGGVIVTTTLAEGRGGNLTINADDYIRMSGAQQIFPLATIPVAEGGNILFSGVSVLLTSTLGTGEAGDFIINTGKLIVGKGVQISTASNGDRGNAGDLTVNASELVEIAGADFVKISENLSNYVPSALETLTLGRGNGGNLTVNTRRLVVRDGGRIVAYTTGAGNAGNVTINADDSVELLRNVDDEIYSGLFAGALIAGVFSQPITGNSGNIVVNTGKLIVSDQARISVLNEGIGNTGNIQVNANIISLDQGTITAETFSVNGGNITLNLRDFLLLRHGSQITTTAGTAEAGGNGGNININALFIIAFPFENSDITANAFLGNGGRITINSQALFGINYRPFLTSLSDITASSQFGLEGEVIINTLNIDPTRGLQQLSQGEIQPQLTQGCEGGRAISAFYEIGKGGISATGDDILFSNPFINQWSDLPTSELDTNSHQIPNINNYDDFFNIPCQNRE